MTAIFIVADTAVAAARVEVLLRGDPAVRAVVLPVGALATFDAEPDP
jgi:hypothetical protein